MAQSFLDAVRSASSSTTAPSARTSSRSTCSADDFGGPELEGCNEHLVLTRPDVIAGMHDAFFPVGVDVVETATFGAFATVLAEYDIADKAYELNRRAAEIAREVASGHSAAGHQRYVAGSMGPGTKLPSLGHIAFADLRDVYEEQARGLLDGGVDLLLVETCYDLLQAKAAMVACRRAMAAAGRVVPIQAQVTIETTGRMLVGSEIGAAADGARGAEARRARPQLRHRARGDDRAHPVPRRRPARYRSRCCPTPACRRSSTAAPTTTSRRRTSPSTTPASSPSTACRWWAAAAARRRTTSRAVIDACRDLEAGAPRPVLEPSVSSIYSPGAHPPGHLVPHHRRAHERQRLQGLPRRDAGGRLGHVREDGQRPDPGGRPRARRLRRLRRPRRHRRHGRDRPPLRHAGERAARARLDRAPGARGGAAAHRRPGHPQLGQPGRRRAARQPHGPRVLAGARVRRRRHLPPHRRARARPATSSGRWRWPTASTRSPPSATACRRRT